MTHTHITHSNLTHSPDLGAREGTMVSTHAPSVMVVADKETVIVGQFDSDEIDFFPVVGPSPG